jgi:hypothetical protein
MAGQQGCQSSQGNNGKGLRDAVSGRRERRKAGTRSCRFIIFAEKDSNDTCVGCHAAKDGQGMPGRMESQ